MKSKSYGVGGKDRIKASLACPTKGMMPTGTKRSVPKGTNFKPKGMKKGK